MLAESLANTLAVALTTAREDERRASVVKAMNNLLILKERKTGIRFILGVKLEVESVERRGEHISHNSH